jgi:hypothetical protein
VDRKYLSLADDSLGGISQQITWTTVHSISKDWLVAGKTG